MLLPALFMSLRKSIFWPDLKRGPLTDIACILLYMQKQMMSMLFYLDANNLNNKEHAHIYYILYNI